MIGTGCKTSKCAVWARNCFIPVWNPPAVTPVFAKQGPHRIRNFHHSLSTKTKDFPHSQKKCRSFCRCRVCRVEKMAATVKSKQFRNTCVIQKEKQPSALPTLLSFLFFASGGTAVAAADVPFFTAHTDWRDRPGIPGIIGQALRGQGACFTKLWHVKVVE